LKRNHPVTPPVVSEVKRRIYIWSSILAVVALAWLGQRAYMAHKNLVTLDVRDADVRDVLRKCEWQTWETIVVHKAVKGKVTINVRKVPLEEVLGVISEQTSTRITAVYPIYSKNKSFVNLRKLARGDIYRDTAGWTNFSMVDTGGGGGRGGPGGPGGFGGFADTVRSQNALVSLNLSAKDLGFASLALRRFSNAQIVPEDGANPLVTVKLQQVPFTEAVAEVAKKANRKWDVFYSVQAQQEPFGRGDFARGDDGGRGRFGRGEDDTNRMSRFEEFAALRERETEARLATMTPEEQAKAKEDQKKMEELRNLPPEERRQAFEQMAANRQGGRGENRMMSGLRNSTPDQRVDRSRRIAERRQRGGGGGRRTQ
jgi:hypothetical protein